MIITQWHVPVDDETCYWYSMFTSFKAPVDKTKMRDQRLQEHRLPDYAPHKNARNNYGYDAEEQGKTPEAWIVSLLGEKFPQESEADAGMSQEEEDKVKERLKALGYMD